MAPTAFSKRLAIRIGRLAGVAADDEMNPRQPAFREARIEDADAALEDLGQISADPRPHLRVVAVARRKHQHRDEAVERIAPRQHAHARPLLQLQDRQRELVERVLVDLEQLVARIALQHIDQRLAGMADPDRSRRGAPPTSTLRRRYGMVRTERV